MFTVADIRDIAIQIENNGEAAYRRAAEVAAEPAVREIFTWMADEEARHAEFFSSIRSTEPLTGEQLEMEKMGRQLLQEMVADQTFSLDAELLGGTTEFTEIVDQARGFEEDTITFYEFLLNLVGDDEARRALEGVIAEERRHIDQLAELRSAGPDRICRNLALV